MKRSAFYFMFLLILSCQVKTPLAENQESESIEKVVSLAEENFGEKYAVLENGEGDYTIVFTKTKNIKDLFATTKFLVYEHKTDSIILEDELNSGIVKWHSQYIVQAIHRNVDDVNNSSGAMTTYYFNVLEKTKSDHVR